ncbi:MAG: GNAT family N-acetyltransferase [Halanaerobiales bacterium]|nr:GNAT family N-acetyltransferase [Halanaerobiales bacterium]
MNYKFEPMKIDQARVIDKWKYTGVVKEIYMDPYFDSFENGDIVLKGPGGCEGFAVYYQDEIIGLFEYYTTDNIMEIGLALNPKYVGKGLGLEFLLAGLKFGIENYNYNKEFIKLNVDKDNTPAVKLYKKAGFEIYNENNDSYDMKVYTEEILKEE